MSNIFVSEQERDFFVYIDPKDRSILHQVGLVGSFISTPFDQSSQTLMFLRNPEFKTFISPFQNTLLRNYAAEYNLEISRQNSFPSYPCRLQAIFLLDSEEESQKYAACHPDHVERRLLKRVRTVGPHLFSIHDSAWINFLRIGHSMDRQTLDFVGRAYWSGELVQDHRLQSMGESWSEDPIMEILFIGRVDFYERQLGS